MEEEEERKLRREDVKAFEFQENVKKETEEKRRRRRRRGNEIKCDCWKFDGSIEGIKRRCRRTRRTPSTLEYEMF